MAGIGAERIFSTVADMREAIEKYFDSCFTTLDDGKLMQIRPITLEGLAYDIGCDRKTIWNYKGRKDINGEEFYPLVKRATDRCQVSLAEHAMTAKNPAGAIWLGCNNYDYVQKVDIQASTVPESLNVNDIRLGIEEEKRRLALIE